MSMARYPFTHFIVTTGWDEAAGRGSITVYDAVLRGGRYTFVHREIEGRQAFFSAVGRLCRHGSASFEEAKRLLQAD